MRQFTTVLLLFLFAIVAAAYVLRQVREAGHDPAVPPYARDGSLDLHSRAAYDASEAVFKAIDSAQSFHLENGLQIIAIPDSDRAEVANIMFYKVGAVDDPAGKSGLAHFLEHLTFAETRGSTSHSYLRTLRRLGGKQDAFTTYDFTVYYQLVTPRRLESVLAVEAHRMSKLQLETVPMMEEREEVQEERREVEATSEGMLDRAMQPLLYPGHPYGRPVLGLPGEFSEIAATDVATFYRGRYAPNNALAIVSGPIETAAVKALVEKHFAGISARTVPKRAVPAPLSASAVAEAVLVESRSMPQSMWRRDFLAPSYMAGATEHAYALQLLAEILGGGPESRLHVSLIDRMKIAARVSVHYDPDSIDIATFSISVTLRAAGKVEDVDRSVTGELQALAGDLVADSVLAHAKQDLKVKAAFSEEQMPAAAKILGEALVRGRSLKDVQSWRRHVDGVTADHVRSAARALATARSVAGTLSGADSARRQP